MHEAGGRGRSGRGCLLACVVLAVCGGGCMLETRVEYLPPRAAREVLERIEENYARVQGPLSASPALVSFRFRDQDGRDRRFIGQPATILFEPPRCLYFSIKSSLGPVLATIGSNEARYWIAVDLPEQRKLWWGTWQALADGTARAPAVPPERLLDALMLRPLPEQVGDSLPALLAARGAERRLLFQRRDADGWPYVAREVLLDSRAPFLPVRILDRRRDGAVVMDAQLGGYQRVSGSGPDGPFTPRRYVLLWPADHAEMRLDVGDVKYRTKAVPFCEFPAAWDGPVESLDEPEAIELSDTRG